jgi:uncharacterized protein (TIGR02646 family)
MIFINKPTEIPEKLQTDGETAKKVLCEKFEKGETKFEFDNKIYGHKDVKTELKKIQNNKCFLCESRITHISHGDVEHFRPKAGCCQNVEDKISETGYYWLAYDWSNLFLACQICNQRFKKNLFPLENKDNRAKSHTDDLSQETPLFIKPDKENPEEHISFRGVVPFARTEKGKITIQHAGLEREELKENRRELYEPIKELFKVAHKYPNFPPEIKQKAIETLNKRLASCILPNHQYSAMFKVAITDKFRY